MQKKIIISFFSLAVFYAAPSLSQTKKTPAFSVSGAAGISYEGYGLNRRPAGWVGYTPRKPWNQVRFNFMPTFKFGKNFSLPFNVNFSAFPTNYAGPYSGIKKQSFSQYITNPMNNFGLNPTYKWAELQLGTQYLKYSELSTGDIGIFGAGFSLKPGTYLIKFFTGVSQQGINFFAGPPVVTGAFKRNNTMIQLGKEEEGKYLVAINFCKGKDHPGSAVPPPLTIPPQEAAVLSLVGDVYMPKGWYIKTEVAQSYFTKNVNTPFAVKSGARLFLSPHTSTTKDYAGQLSLGKKSKDFDIGLSSKYLGAGYQTMGYPYLQPDRLDYTINTRFNAWKDSNNNYKMNVVASIGQRVNNVTNTSLKATQFIGNLNWFTQFNDHWNLNINYNNCGFQSASGINPYGIKNVSNDFGFNPTYNWSNDKMSHLLSLSYNFSKYDERDVITGATTSNNTHTGLLTYVPTYFNRPITPDFSVMYFYNDVPGVKIKLATISSGLSMPAGKKKPDGYPVRLRGQLQYTLGKLNSFSSNKNLIASVNVDYKLTKKLTWNTYLTTNFFKYGNEIIPNGANYLESICRTGFQYKFGSKK